MKQTIHSGQTLTLPLDKAGDSSLVIQGGYPGLSNGYAVLAGNGTLAAGASLLAQGGLAAYAGASPRTGGTATLIGTLANLGTIAIAGGYLGGYSGSGTREPGGGGGLFRDRGVLTNAGLIVVDGAVAAGSFTASQSGTFDLAGVLLNTGTIALSTGTPSSPHSMGAAGGVLTDSGTLTNEGLIIAQAGGPRAASIYNGYGSGFLNVAATGTLNNAGTILLDGAGAPPAPDRSGFAGGLNIYGTLNNTGLIAVSGGGPGARVGNYNFPGYGASLQITAGGTSGAVSKMTNAGTILVNGGTGGTASQPAGGGGGNLYVRDGGTLLNTGVITVAGGNAGVGGPSYSGGGGGRFMVTGSLNNTGMITIGAGLNPSAPGGFAGFDAKLEIGGGNTLGVLTNAGTISLNSGSAYRPSSGSFSLDIYSRTGELVLAGGSMLGNGSISNGGTITGTGSIAGGSLINDGEVNAPTGLLSINEQITGDGTFTVGATLGLAGSVTTTERYGHLEMSTVVLDQTGLLDLTSGTAGIKIVSPYGGTADLVGGGTATLYAVDTDLTIDLTQAATLTLSEGLFVTAIGSAGNDTITAMASGQTLTGGLGTDLLIGAAATGDVFRDTAAGLNGDTIGDFAGTDIIDITNIASGTGLTLAFMQGAGSGVLTVANGAEQAAIILLGSFSQTQFTTTADGHGGVNIGLHG